MRLPREERRSAPLKDTGICQDYVVTELGHSEPDCWCYLAEFARGCSTKPFQWRHIPSQLHWSQAPGSRERPPVANPVPLGLRGLIRLPFWLRLCVRREDNLRRGQRSDAYGGGRTFRQTRAVCWQAGSGPARDDRRGRCRKARVRDGVRYSRRGRGCAAQTGATIGAAGAA